MLREFGVQPSAEVMHPLHTTIFRELLENEKHQINLEVAQHRVQRSAKMLLEILGGQVPSLLHHGICLHRWSMVPSADLHGCYVRRAEELRCLAMRGAMLLSCATGCFENCRSQSTSFASPNIELMKGTEQWAPQSASNKQTTCEFLKVVQQNRDIFASGPTLNVLTHGGHI